MKVVGLITEYNPFHNGHKYHIEEAKRITGADYAIAVMSGNFVQRGAPAIIDKYSRTRMALQNGIDLVLELPVCYATGSAEYFAHGAISTLNKLGIVDYLCFGSECGDISLLQDAADFLTNTPVEFERELSLHIKRGLTYPAARLKAYQSTLKKVETSGSSAATTKDGNDLSKVLTEPNNILGIEYLKALKNLSSSIKPVTIKRIVAHYHDSNLSTASVALEQGKIAISSATAIRKAINHTGQKTNNDNSMSNDHYFREMEHSVPKSVYDILSENFMKRYPILEEDFSSIIRYKLMTEDSEALSRYQDITGDLAERLKNLSDYNLPMSELLGIIKTKNMTQTRINRALIHILLNLRSEVMTDYIRNGYTFYTRVLGIKIESSHLLRKIKACELSPIITKVSRAELDSLGSRMLSEDLFATHLYNQAVYEKFGTVLPNEYKHGILLM